jgi:membrane protein implicated in regulation of membrane protease activity
VRRIKDIAMQSAGLVSLALAVLLTVGGAVALGTLTGQYGLFGWLVFLILMACWFMFAVPFIVSASALHKAGSPRHRREKAQRVADQARRYGLDVTPVDDELPR